MDIYYRGWDRFESPNSPLIFVFPKILFLPRVNFSNVEVLSKWDRTRRTDSLFLSLALLSLTILNDLRIMYMVRVKSKSRMLLGHPKDTNNRCLMFPHSIPGLFNSQNTFKCIDHLV